MSIVKCIQASWVSWGLTTLSTRKEDMQQQQQQQQSVEEFDTHEPEERERSRKADTDNPTIVASSHPCPSILETGSSSSSFPRLFPSFFTSSTETPAYPSEKKSKPGLKEIGWMEGSKCTSGWCWSRMDRRVSDVCCKIRGFRDPRAIAEIETPLTNQPKP